MRPAPARAGAPIGQLTAYSPRTSAAHGDAGPDSERWRSTAARTMRWRGFSSSAAASIGGAPGHAPGSPMGRSGGRGAPGASRRPSLPAHSSTNDRISWSLDRDVQAGHRLPVSPPDGGDGDLAAPVGPSGNILEHASRLARSCAPSASQSATKHLANYRNHRAGRGSRLPSIGSSAAKATSASMKALMACLYPGSVLR